MNLYCTALLVTLAAALTLPMGGMAFAADLKPATAQAAPQDFPGDTGGIDNVIPPAQAGDGLRLSTKPSGPAPISPKDIPDVLLKEMKDVETRCEDNYFYSSFHDCKCISVKYLDARLKSNPNTAKDQVFNSVAGQCVDEPAIAGYIYKSCGDYMQHVRKDYVAFCKCTANNVAEAYNKAPAMSLRYIEGLRRNAFLACGIANKVERPDNVIPEEYR